MAVDRETQAGAEFGQQLLRQAAIEGIHPQIFLCRVVGHVIGTMRDEEASLHAARAVIGACNAMVRYITTGEES